ncbi:hypothetical protein GOP47_0014723 [Adiantum capillus-veneris]|uniref:Beta-glucosidase n=1 Tax=Adiantum capillus-veneris TaxID=13818 RepID=A0A9D4UM16_ADICA|nr:hypothetical protein GOP47_0014723 [Adiantum capillus-veneris]
MASCYFVYVENGIMDASLPVETRVSDLLSRMTLREKIGQMIQFTNTKATSNPSLIADYGIGSLLSGGNNPAPKPFASPKDWPDMVDVFQNQALQTRLAIPLLYGIDAVHGHNSVFGATIFPHNIGLGCTRDLYLVRRIGEVTALEVQATGIPYVFSPAVSVCRHPSWGRCYESFGEDPELVKSMTEIISGLQGVQSKPGYPSTVFLGKVIATAKHFVGDGGTEGGMDKGDTLSSFQILNRIHIQPFKEAISKGINTVMVSYSSWQGKKLHANHFLLSKVLKKQLNFKGFVISDFRGIDMLTDPPDSDFTYSIMAAINAGIDMVMQPWSAEGFVGNLTELVLSGQVSVGRINDAVRRILGVKFRSGVFEHPFTARSLLDVVGAKAHRDLAREAVRKSLVLLKNGKLDGKSFLPLDKSAGKILVAGSHADDLGNQCGGWTLTRQGSSGNITIGTTVLSAIRKTVSAATEVVYTRSVRGLQLLKEEFEYAIVVVGEFPYSQTEGDNRNLTIPEEGLQVIDDVCRSINCLVILISGRPLVLTRHLPLMDALVAAWLPGTEGEGITDVIFGDYDFEGRLSRTWFNSIEQLPMNYGDAVYDPLFPYDFGLRMYSDSSAKVPPSK